MHKTTHDGPLTGVQIGPVAELRIQGKRNQARAQAVCTEERGEGLSLRSTSLRGVSTAS